MSAPDADMMALATRLERFIATTNDAELDGLFAREVTIIENFAPHIFRDVATWRDAMRRHVHALSDLAFAFGPAHNFAVTGERAYFDIPITWTGMLHGKPFEELGGSAFVLQREGGIWRIAGYAWSVVGMRFTA
ncbi:MAG TPA: hypothetical protein VGC36_06490 [Rhizomicrobium sp.]